MLLYVIYPCRNTFIWCRFRRPPDHYINRFYCDNTLQKLDAVTLDGDTAHHTKTIEREKLRVGIIMFSSFLSSIHHKVANWLPCQDLSSSAAMLSAPEGPREQEQMFVTATLTFKNPRQSLKKQKNFKPCWTSSGCVRTAYLETVLEHPWQRNQATPKRCSFLATFLLNFLQNL